MYIGNGAYCYANSASMFIRETGEGVPPYLLEVLSGVGLGATLYESGSLFLHNNTADPDVGISKAMSILGYSFIENFSDQEAECPLNELRKVLETSPAILGPLDMGYLTYSPNHRFLLGADHYILAYRMDEHFIYVHDPAGFPHVRLPLEQLQLAWKAEKLPYGRGSYQYWHSLTRIHQPSEDEIYDKAMDFFQHLYKETGKIGATIGAKTGKEAIEAFSEKLQNQEMSEDAAANLKYFVFQLGARRAGDYARFFKEKNPELAKLKMKQSVILGLCHSLTVEENWLELSSVLRDFAVIEEEFESKLLSHQVAKK
ncbi:hypothetical protein ACE3NQ_17180 [Paenibacillus terreus]|uniref:Butirosin biosynthesis protein H, N-terminal n=1 Tax=Paenibacillus terreus TaxID=1387834 RepID=A0ABV5BAC6_9BACL